MDEAGVTEVTAESKAAEVSKRRLDPELVTKFKKKTYHISVRSKISPNILTLDKTHVNFDKDYNIKNRARIVKLLRQDSMQDKEKNL